ncbi:hypothetical protein HPB50_001030 [Hyalomma asiaticum]|uniref:Uncharacterized protein n=1 Tax=Hyalomma asiaticum TaxID=266040 RepID=A0ACB7RRP0_HYAAI|nr:hypothetical protein HPB50_001030 [Hyalomma asiaticum]
MDLEELISLGGKLALSGDALRAWIEEQSAREREELAEERDARREQAEREARAHHSNEGEVHEYPGNDDECHKQSSEELTADASWVPVIAIMSHPTDGHCRSEKSEVALSDSSLVLPDAVTGDLDSVVNCRGNVPQNLVLLGVRECYSVSDRENEPTDVAVLKESKEDSYESTCCMRKNDSHRGDITKVAQ